MSETGNWCLIESDPGVFTELIKGFGAEGLECDEVYDLSETSCISDALGLIFLFKWEKTKTDEAEKNLDGKSGDLFFAKQVINNACATQAIINMLLNLSDKVKLGDTLKQFKSFVAEFDCSMKGVALSNSTHIREVHNSFSNFQAFEFDEKMAKKGDEVYHFVAYVPVNGNLFELDGLQEGPINHGVIPEKSSWLDVARPVLEKRMQKCLDGSFNLMAVVPSRLAMYERQLSQLKGESAEQSSRVIQELQSNIASEKRKAASYRQENIRRRHNYLPLIVEVLKVLGENSCLVDAMGKAKSNALERHAKSKASSGKK